MQASRLPADTGPRLLRPVLALAVAFTASPAVAQSVACGDLDQGPHELAACVDFAAPPSLLGDAGRLRQVLINLLNNAIKFTGEGEVAVEVSLTSRADDAVNLRVVLMDCLMPVMDGFEATARVRALERESGEHQTIIALTANAMSGDRERCLEAGVGEYLSRPIDRTRLAALMDAWMPHEQRPTPRSAG